MVSGTPTPERNGLSQLIEETGKPSVPVRELKGEPNLDKKWQSDDLFYIIMNEIHPRFNQF